VLNTISPGKERPESPFNIEVNDRPLITFALIAYNQERFIRDAVNGAFSQTYSPLEIILSDDCSTDNTYDIMAEMARNYNGPHKIILNRNPVNLGIGAHINRIMELSSGELIVGAAGDDISVSNRVERTYQIYKSTKAKSIFSNCLTIDEFGKPSNLLYEKTVQHKEFSPKVFIEKELSVAGCSHAWNRDVFEVFGPLMTPLTCEDWVIPFRSSLLGQIEYVNEILVMHRIHDNNAWNYKMKTDIDRDIEFQRFWIFEKKAIYNNWLKDLQIMEKISPLRKEELMHLQNIINERLLDIEGKILMLNGNLTEKVKNLIKNILKKGVKFRTIRHDIGFFLIPQIYRKYMILKSKRHL
jgi:glycosyltransferase involved in cell wall biosynthesis